MTTTSPAHRTPDASAGGPAGDAEFAAHHREAMITKHLPLVRYVAGSMARHSNASSIVDYDDLVGYGTEGLIEAVDTFNPAYNVRFSTWAVMHIRTTIQDALRSLDPLPRSLRSKGKEIERVSYDLANRNGYWPNDEQVATALGVAVQKVRVTMRDINHTVVSLENVEESHGDDGGYSWLSSLADHDPETDPEASLDTAEMHSMLLDAVDTLPEREGSVIRMYYRQGQSMRAIADKLGVSESRVSQLHARALKMLRESLNAALHDTPRVVA
ncbi:MAG: sigma-70 family RNA polymerase sigma factor [Dehalococcoidia bacterium]